MELKPIRGCLETSWGPGDASNWKCIRLQAIEPAGALHGLVASKMESMFEKDQSEIAEPSEETWNRRSFSCRLMKRACYTLRLLL